jgi:hypothetical protein
MNRPAHGLELFIDSVDEQITKRRRPEAGGHRVGRHARLPDVAEGEAKGIELLTRFGERRKCAITLDEGGLKALLKL